MATFATEGVRCWVLVASSALYGVVVARHGAASCQPTRQVSLVCVSFGTFVSQDGFDNSYLALLA